MTKRILVAKIATAHGIKGLVKLHVYVEDISLLNNKLYTDESGDQSLSLSLKNAMAKHWLAAVDGITDRNQAELLRGTPLYLDEKYLPEPDDEEFYISDLIGLPCYDNNMYNGEVIAVENFGASDLLEIKPKIGESFYLPFTDETILEIKEDRIEISIPEGLID